MIEACELPSAALLSRYREGGGYADCYATEIGHAVSHAAYVEAFYTTAVFKLERFMLRWLASRPSADAQARELAAGARDSFAAWRVEARASDQLLMCDLTGRTRSWLMVQPLPDAVGKGAGATRLLFGSAVVPVTDARSGRSRMGLAFRLLLGFHKLYSRVLLAAAKSRLAALHRQQGTA